MQTNVLKKFHVKKLVFAKKCVKKFRVQKIVLNIFRVKNNPHKKRSIL